MSGTWNDTAPAKLEGSLYSTKEAVAVEPQAQSDVHLRSGLAWNVFWIRFPVHEVCIYSSYYLTVLKKHDLKSLQKKTGRKPFLGRANLTKIWKVITALALGAQAAFVKCQKFEFWLDF